LVKLHNKGSVLNNHGEKSTKIYVFKNNKKNGDTKDIYFFPAIQVFICKNKKKEVGTKGGTGKGEAMMEKEALKNNLTLTLSPTALLPMIYKCSPTNIEVYGTNIEKIGFYTALFCSNIYDDQTQLSKII
jgi:hypothetical protein